MKKANSTREDILDTAESMIRTAGYNGFSTRDVADAIGIKAPSVHYHFPRKEDIGIAVVERYTTRFLGALGDPTRFVTNPGRPVRLYIDAFRSALLTDRNLCLCGVLGAETAGVPEAVAAKTKEFFQQNLKWLTSALAAASSLKTSELKCRAALILSALEGAMIVSQSLGDDSVFKRVASVVLRVGAE